MRHIYSLLALLVMAAVCGSALRWGGPPERRVAVLFAAAWVGQAALQRVMGEVAPVYALAALDAAVFALLAVATWRDRRSWMAYALGWQGVALGVHLIRMISPGMPRWTYLSALSATGYVLLALLAWGTWRHRRGISS